MSGRADFHRLARDINVRQLFKLVIHAGQFPFDVLGGVGKFLFDPGDVQENPPCGLPRPSLISRTMQRAT